MEGAINILNFDQVYQNQKSWQSNKCEWINLLDLKSVNGYCSSGSLRVIDKKLRKRHNKDITLIGSGNYHYVTYLLLAERKSPFSLVLFDNHTEMMPPPCKSLVSCGSWVLNSLKHLPLLKKVVIIGARADLAAVIPRKFNSKVAVFSTLNWQATLANEILNAIPTQDIYISIDKDVLNKSEAITNWDQGSMKLADLLVLLKFLGRYKKVYGLDICGELPTSPVDFFKKKVVKANRINEKANCRILEVVKRDYREGC
jgi:arginase family enzyme